MDDTYHTHTSTYSVVPVMRLWQKLSPHILHTKIQTTENPGTLETRRDCFPYQSAAAAVLIYYVILYYHEVASPVTLPRSAIRAVPPRRLLETAPPGALLWVPPNFLRATLPFLRAPQVVSQVPPATDTRTSYGSCISPGATDMQGLPPFT